MLDIDAYQQFTKILVLDDNGSLLLHDKFSLNLFKKKIHCDVKSLYSTWLDANYSVLIETSHFHSISNMLDSFLDIFLSDYVHWIHLEP